MKNLVAALVVCVALATASFDADAAKRFGGGGSLGRPAPTFLRKPRQLLLRPPQLNSVSNRERLSAPSRLRLCSSLP